MRSTLFLALHALPLAVLVAACDTTAGHYAGADAGASPGGTVVVGQDGTLQPLDPGAPGLGQGLGERPAVVVAGAATYGTGNVSDLRLSIRQTAGGTIEGDGEAVIFGQSVALMPNCVRLLSSFGLDFYGVNVAFSEPLVMTTPYGTVSYTHGAISVTDGGGLGSLVLGNAPACRASALLYPYLPQAGAIRVLTPRA